jgi:large subunit ribosomal protein L25
MENLFIEAVPRKEEELKKNATSRLRKEGYIPSVVYGLGQEPLTIKVGRQSFKDLIKGKGLSGHIFDISVKDGSKKAKKITVLLKDIQREPLTRELTHLDFLRIEMEKEVVIDVPIALINDAIAIGVKDEGGVLAHGLKEISISCLPKDIPEHIELDIADLKLGESIKVSDIKLEDNVKILTDSEEVVASITYSTQLEEEPEEEEAVEVEPELIGKEKAEEEPVEETKKEQ